MLFFIREVVQTAAQLALGFVPVQDYAQRLITQAEVQQQGGADSFQMVPRAAAPRLAPARYPATKALVSFATGMSQFTGLSTAWSRFSGTLTAEALLARFLNEGDPATDIGSDERTLRTLLKINDPQLVVRAQTKAVAVFTDAFGHEMLLRAAIALVMLDEAPVTVPNVSTLINIYNDCATDEKKSALANVMIAEVDIVATHENSTVAAFFEKLKNRCGISFANFSETNLPITPFETDFYNHLSEDNKQKLRTIVMVARLAKYAVEAGATEDSPLTGVVFSITKRIIEEATLETDKDETLIKYALEIARFFSWTNTLRSAITSRIAQEGLADDLTLSHAEHLRHQRVLGKAEEILSRR